jgi:clorobiocin biosynthesis protein CloN6
MYEESFAGYNDLMIKDDLILIHAPSIYDFRNRDDVLFAFLSTGGTIAVSQIYEMYPLGLKAIQTSLQQSGKRVSIVNLAQMMLQNPSLDVESFLTSLDARMFGLDLFWLVHTQGALAVAKLLKRIHSDVPVIFGGISSSLFYRELIEYPQVDFVIRGSETSLFINMLLDKLSDDRYGDIPNLCWKDEKKNVIVNDFQPNESYIEAVNWSSAEENINYFVTIPGAGCEYNCTLCGGSSYSMEKHYRVKDGFAQKNFNTFLEELNTIKNHKGKSKRIVTLHHWFEDLNNLKKVLDTLKDGDIKTIHYTLYHLLSEEHIELMSQYEIKPVFELSIESSEREVRKACGKPTYSNSDIELWLDKLFAINPKNSVEIYFMIGLPKQTVQSVMDDVRYCDHLLTKYSRFDVNTFICPMVPFLVPGSLVADNAAKFGYRVLFNTLKDYEKALIVSHWKDSLNYETKWMTKKEIVDVSYRACKELVLIKQKTQKLPKVLAKSIIDKIDTTVDLLRTIEQYNGKQLPRDIREKIRQYNNEILKSAPTQQSPFNFSIYKNWYE